MKHIVFTVNDEKHFITFQLSLIKGIYYATFDGQEVKITDAYPPLNKLIGECASIILHDLRIIIKKIARKKKHHIPSD